MKKIAVMQPYLFPYLGYFQLIHVVEEFVIFDDVQYIVRGWINRNNLLINNEPKLFTISLEGASPNKLINEIQIKDDFAKFQRTVEQTYAKAPFVDDVKALVARICEYEDRNLAMFIGNSLKEIMTYIGIETSLNFSSHIPQQAGRKGQDKILEICKLRNADTYINAIGGRELYSKDDFAKHDIELRFIKSRLPEYKQFGDSFYPGLSIIDVLMFNSVQEVKEMLEQYELV